MRYHRTGGKDISVDARNMRPFLNQGGGDTYQVKVSDDDTTPGYLSGKITSADASVVITVANDGADEDLDLSVAVYVAAEIDDHAGNPDAHHAQVHVLATTSGLGADHTVSGLTAGQVLRATGASTAAFASLQAADLPVHVIATNVGLGSQHSISGATAGHVLRASGATAAAFAQLQHSDLGGVTADQHHNQVHALAGTSGLGADHTVSGLTAGQVLRATSATTAAFASLQATDLPSHVLATNTALGSQHTISGATAGHVLRASSATAAAFSQLQHSDLGGVSANQHHNQSHVLATTAGLGADHTTSGLTAGQVLRATGATTAAFASLQATDLPAHVLATNLALGSQHTISGATAGHVLRASGATAANFQQLSHSDLGGVSANQHHNQSHVLASTSGLGADHTVSGLTARQVLVATGATTALFRAVEAADLPTGATLSVSSSNSGNSHAITSSSNPGAAASILASNASGYLQIARLGLGIAPTERLHVEGDIIVTNAGTEVIRFNNTDDYATEMDIEFSFSGAMGASDNMHFHIDAANTSTARYFAWLHNARTSSATELMRLTEAGTLYLGDTANGGMTQGITINQGGDDDEILAFKSSDVAHGMTTIAETDTYGRFLKRDAAAGGVRLDCFSETTIAAAIFGIATTADTGKSASAGAAIELRAALKSGTSAGAMSANGNLLIVRSDSSTRWIVDAEGDTHRDGTDNTFDFYHDAHLARAFDRAVSPGSVVDSDFDAWVQYGRDDLIAAGILHESGFYNESRLLRLAIGAVWQEYTERQRLTLRVQELERRLLN